MIPFSLFLALKYLRPKRSFVSVVTVISIIGVILGVAILVIVMSIMTGFDDMWNEKIQGFAAHLTVMERNGGSITNDEQVLSTIRKVKGVTGAAQHVQTVVLVRRGDVSAAPFVIGMDPDDAAAVSRLPGSIVRNGGRFDLSEGNVVVGVDLARQLGVWVGSRVVVYSPKCVMAENEIRLPDELTVSGIFELGMWEFDSSFMVTSLGTAREMCGMDRGSMAIRVMTDDPSTAGELGRRIVAELGGDIRLYVDGEDQGKARYAIGPMSESSALTGCLGNSLGALESRGFNGMIDEVMFHNRPLTGDEVRQIYNLKAGDMKAELAGENDGKAVQERELSNLTRGLVLYYPFDTDKGGRVGDRSGRNSHGKVRSAQWTPDGRFGGAYRFSGGTDHVVVDCRAMRKSFADGFSIGMWFCPEAFNPRGENTLLGISAARGGKDGTSGYSICAGRPGNRGGDYAVGFCQSSHGRDKGFYPGMFGLEKKKWHHVAGVYESEFMALTWMEMNKTLFDALRVEKSMMFLLLIFITVVAMFTVTVTLLLIGVQKTDEIGLLKAIGFSPWQIMRVFVWHGWIQCIVGEVCGIGAGMLCLHYRNEILQWLSARLGVDLFPKAIYLLSEIPSHTTAGDVIKISLAVFLLCTLASIVPAARAAALKPVDALRHE